MWHWFYTPSLPKKTPIYPKNPHFTQPRYGYTPPCLEKGLFWKDCAILFDATHQKRLDRRLKVWYNGRGFFLAENNLYLYKNNPWLAPWRYSILYLMENSKTTQKRLSKKVILQAIAEKGVDKKIVESLARSNIEALLFVKDLLAWFYEPRRRYIPQCDTPWRTRRLTEWSVSEKGTVVVIAVGKCEKQQTFLFLCVRI